MSPFFGWGEVRNPPIGGRTMPAIRATSSSWRAALRFARPTAISATYFLASALAVALTIASEVIVALVVVSTPFTCCLAMILVGVSLMAE